MFDTLLIANRGEIALRVMRTARRLGIRTVAVYSDADAGAPHVSAADVAYRIGPAPARESYLNIPALLAAAQASGADAVHPGYGFLSENAAFTEAVAEAGLRFVGPSAEAIRAMGLKDTARRLAAEAGAPVIPGYDGGSQEPDLLAEEARRIGFPVMIKARAGGGGKGMRAVTDPDAFPAALAAAQAEAEASFGDGAVLIEKLIAQPRHLEVQVFGDRQGGLVHLFERDCSLQRRHQKVIEEAPGPGVDETMRAALTEAALAVARSVAYEGAGTVEFIADGADGLSPERFYFLEMNTRLQVEHPVTEAITGLDLVEWQLRVAAGEPLPLRQEQIERRGWAVEARIYAEAPARDFAPSIGQLARIRWPDPGAFRVEAGVIEGQEVTPHYDPMVAKLIATGPDRRAALAALAAGLDQTEIDGVESNVGFLARLCRMQAVRDGAVETGLIGAAGAALAADPEPSPALRALAAVAAAGGFADHAGAEETTPSVAQIPASTAFYRPWGAAARDVALRDAGGGELGPSRVSHLGGGRFQVTWQVTWAGRETPISLTVDPGARLGRRCGVTAGGDGQAAAPARMAAQIDRFTAPRAGRPETRLMARLGDERAAFILADPLAERGAGAEASGDAALTPMPGVIRAVLVEPGAEVASGQPLVEMEAMKMALTLSAPRDGVVASVAVAEGDQVTEGLAAVVLE
ncbi:MAG: biotin carboxylase N-terminal domain-containing protein [Pseudomonadota bacterium]